MGPEPVEMRVVHLLAQHRADGRDGGVPGQGGIHRAGVIPRPPGRRCGRARRPRGGRSCRWPGAGSPRPAPSRPAPGGRRGSGGTSPGGRGGRSGLGTEEKRHPLAREGVGPREGDGVGDAGHRHHHVLDLARIDVEARDVDRVAQARDEDQHAVGRPVAEIAGPHRAGLALDHDLRRRLGAWSRGHPVMGQGAADRVGPLQVRVHRDAAGFRAAVLLEQVLDPGPDGGEPRRRQQGAGGHRRMDALALRQQPGERVQHGRRGIEQRPLGLAQAAQQVARVAGIEHHRRPPRCRPTRRPQISP